MASQTLYPSTAVDDASIGTRVWSSPDKAEVDDGVVAFAGSDPGGTQDNSIKIVKGGSISGTNQSSGASWSVNSMAYVSFGGSSSLWGLSWTPADINASDFGFAVSATSGSGTTHYLKVTSFGFSVPTGSAIDGILVEIKREHFSQSLSFQAWVDAIRITVYYTPATGNFFAFFGH